MTTFRSFPDIAVFRNAINSVTNLARYVGKDENGDPVYDGTISLPTLTFTGTTKLHGTNAAIGYNLNTETKWAQSRNNIITPEADNEGFAKFVETVDIKQLLELLDISFLENEVVIYGEWCGKGIQKGVAINELDKMFVVFAVCTIDVEDERYWIRKEEVKKIRIPEQRVFNIYDGPTYEITIDFNKPVLSTEQLDELTIAVENECPFAKLFNVSGIGEGIVWICQDPEWNTSRIWFKVKGAKHQSSKGKTKKLAPADIEKAKNSLDFADRVVTDSRCEQSLDQLRMNKKPQDRTSLGDFIRWIVQDVLKEESDVMEESGLDAKSIGGPIAKKAKEWFFQWEKDQL